MRLIKKDTNPTDLASGEFEKFKSNKDRLSDARDSYYQTQEFHVLKILAYDFNSTKRNSDEMYEGVSGDKYLSLNVFQDSLDQVDRYFGPKKSKT